jgi:hypothetical protein
MVLDNLLKFYSNTRCYTTIGRFAKALSSDNFDRFFDKVRGKCLQFVLEDYQGGKFKYKIWDHEQLNKQFKRYDFEEVGFSFKNQYDALEFMVRIEKDYLSQKSWFVYQRLEKKESYIKVEEKIYYEILE